MDSTPDPEATLARIADKVEPVAEYCRETYHPKLPKGKPFVIVRECERITVELKPRGGREAVLVVIESLDKESE